MNSVTYTAQVLGTLNLPALWALAASVIVAALGALASQGVIEGIVAGFLPTPLFFVKPFLPSALSGLVSAVALHLGVAPDDVAAGAVTLASATHWVNEQSWAVSLENKVPKIWVPVLKALGIGKTVALVVLSLLALGAGLHADVTTTASPSSVTLGAEALYLVPNVTVASAMETFGASGALTPANGTVGGFEEDLTWGTSDGSNFQGLASVGVQAGVVTQLGVTRMDVGLMLNYLYGGVGIFEPLGNGLQPPLLGAKAGIPLDVLEPWDWKLKL